MGIKSIPRRIPRSFTHQKSLRSRKKRLCTMAKINIGQNSSFICSHVDSFTPENGAIHAAFPSQSYKKCKTVPPSEVMAKPKSWEIPIDRFINSPINVLLNSVFGGHWIYATNMIFAIDTEKRRTVNQKTYCFVQMLTRIHIKKCCESYHHSDMLQSKYVLLLFMNKNETDKMKKMVKMLK